MPSQSTNSKKKVVILTFYTNAKGNITEDFLNDPGSMASSRIQILPMAHAAIHSGYKVEVWSLHSENPEDLELLIKDNSVSTIFIGKMSASTDKKQLSMIMANTAAVFRLKRNGARVILFYSDNHLARDDRIGRFYRDILHLTDIAITPSKTLEKIVKEYSLDSIKYITVSDPWQVNEQLFTQQNLKDEVNLIWFGHGANINYLISLLPKLAAKCEGSKHFILTILTRKEGLIYFRESLPKNIFSKNKWTLKLTEWEDMNQPDQMNQLLKEASISLIPSDPNDPRKTGVSHNRVVDSIRAGCIAIASPMPSYLELQNVCVLTKDFSYSIYYVIKNYESLSNLITLKRHSALQKFSPEHNSDLWTEILKNNFNTKILNTKKS